ncbi:hypothetical protein GCM10027578_19420 [Spirosoma luteolum]
MRLLTSLLLIALATRLAAQPLQLLPQNPHYLQYNGRPLLLIGSGEHYGGVINLDFDYRRYLQTLRNDGLNTTRLFTGAYVEKLGDFGIQKNTLAPAANRLVLPWARSGQPGYALGGNRFDLNRWDEAYFERLRSFMAEARQQEVIVEITLFSSYYGTGWPYSPFNPANNINQTDAINPLVANTPQNGNVLAYQEAYVRKLVRELNDFPNFYIELQNEPWADQQDTVLIRNDYHLTDKGQPEWRATIQVVSQASIDWQRRVADWIVSEEKSLPNRHLMSQNVSNFRYPINNPDPNVGIYTFHYALPEVVADNYALQRVIGFNETGFAGQADQTYRRQAWRFLMAGGGLFNQLDYSFAVGAETGQDTTYRGGPTPGGGSPSLRRQFGVLRRFFDGLDLTTLAPDAALVVAAPGAMTWTLKTGNRGWVIYAEPMALTPFTLQLQLPEGTYQAVWTNPVTGGVVKAETVSAGDVLTAPVARQDLLLQLSKR